MSPKRPTLTPAVEREILSFVRAGGYPHVAAEAAGVPRELFDRWMRQGESKRGAKKYHAFCRELRKAQAQARLGAEVTARDGKPLDWLRNGPGRESADDPGWTGTVKPTPTGAAPSPLLTPEFQTLCAALLRALAPFPEARAAVAAALEEARGQSRG